MYIERVPNRNSPPAVLLRESYREGDKVKKRTLANLSKLPEDVVENMKLALKGGQISIESGMPSNFEVIRSLPHGHVAAILETMKKLGLSQIISKQSSRKKNLVLAMIVARIINPKSKLATCRGFNHQTCSNSLGQLLNLENAKEDELYEALDWLLEQQSEIEDKLAEKHLIAGSLVLYDVTSSYLEGTGCELGLYGYNRDKKKGKTQIVFGLLCDANGCPIAVEVFSGNTSDSATLTNQIEKVRNRFGIKNIVWVTDRGILTNANINELVKPIEGLDYISGLTKPQIRKLAEVKVIQLGLFDELNLVEFESEDYPEERLVACRNPLIAEKNHKQREAILEAVEKELSQIVKATKREKRALKGQDKIALRVGKVLNKYRVNKYYTLAIKDAEFSYERRSELIAQEAAVEWHLRKILAPLLFEDEENEDITTDVIKAHRSESAKKKDRTKRNQENLAIHSFRTLLEDLGTICLNKIKCNFASGSYVFSKITQPSSLQQYCLNLLEVSLSCTQ